MKNAVKSAVLFGAGVIVAFIVFAAITNLSTAATTKAANSFVGTSNGNAEGNGQVEASTVTVQGSQYVFSKNEFTQGSTVRLEFDMKTLYGCSRSIVIPEFGVRKLLSESDNIVEFTASKAGTFNLACSMNMYRGSFTILKIDGSKSDYVQAAPLAGSDGGCGCGGGSAGVAGTCGVA